MKYLSILVLLFLISNPLIAQNGVRHTPGNRNNFKYYQLGIEPKDFKVKKITIRTLIPNNYSGFIYVSQIIQIDTNGNVLKLELFDLNKKPIKKHFCTYYNDSLMKSHKVVYYKKKKISVGIINYLTNGNYESELTYDSIGGRKYLRREYSFDSTNYVKSYNKKGEIKKQKI